MRLNPFSRSDYGSRYMDDEEHMAVARTKHGSKRGPHDDRHYGASDRAHGHSQAGRARSRSRTRRGDRSMTPDSRRRTGSRRESSPEDNVERQRNVRRVRDATPDARKPANLSRNLISLSEAERRPSQHSGVVSKAPSSRRSQVHSSSESEGEEETSRRRRQKKKHGQQVPEPTGGRGRSRHKSEDEDEDEDDGKTKARNGPSAGKAKIVPLSSLRRSRSQGASSDSEDEDQQMVVPQRRKSISSSQRPRSVTESERGGGGRKRSPAPIHMRKVPKNKPPPPAARSSWGIKFPSSPFARRKSLRNTRDDEVDIESDSDDDRQEVTTRSRGRKDRSELRDPPPNLHPPSPPIAKLGKHYMAPKPAFANLYEYDTFPAVDRVPTAIGYRSDDSEEREGKDDDHHSLTSRYSVNVKSVRSAKLKGKNRDNSNVNHNQRGIGDAFSHDENDDKYAQYQAGTLSNAVLSDSSESCPPVWNPVLDADDSDWYDDDEAAANDKLKQQNKNKKYQVSGSKPQGVHKKKKIPVTTDAPKASKEDTLLGRKRMEDKKNKGPPEEEQEGKRDEIVANRSEASDVIPNSSRHPGFRHAPALGDVDEEDSDDDDVVKGRPQRKQPAGKNTTKRLAKNKQVDEYTDDEDSSHAGYSNDKKPKKNRKQSRKPNKNKGAPMSGKMTQSRKKTILPSSKGKSAAKSLKNKFKGFRLGGRAPPVDDASSSGDSTDNSESMGFALSHSLLSEDNSSHVDQAVQKLEMDELKESTATHNMNRTVRKELLELDEMDDESVKSSTNPFSCGVFPFALGLTGGGAPNCFYGSSRLLTNDEIQLDSIQMQRLKDAKHDFETKPKVEVILQDLQDPLAEKYDQVEKMQKKKQREAERGKKVQKEIEKREHEELLRKKKEMRETEQKKIQMAQNRDHLSLQEAPDLNRGNSQNFVMDISNWVLNLDNADPSPRKTPQTNGRTGSSLPIEKLPFDIIEVPTSVDSIDSELKSPAKSRRARQQQNGVAIARRRKSSDKKKKATKKKGWFRR